MAAVNDTAAHPYQSDFGVMKIVTDVIIALNLAINLMGVVNNVINMIVFKKLFSVNPININFFFLALVDFGISLTSIVTSTSMFSWTMRLLFDRFNIISGEVLYISVGVPRSVLQRMSILLTALLTVSRCICVAKPIKAKVLVTRRTLKWSIGVAFFLSSVNLIPIYYVNRLQWVYEPLLEDTYLRRTVTEDFLLVSIWHTAVDVTICQILPYMSIIVSTCILIVKLRKRSNWRKTRLTSSVVDQNVMKETKIIKTVVIVAGVFVSCYIHNVATFIATALGTVWNVNEILDHEWLMPFIMVVLLLDSINASVNFFIYYKNSTTFKDTVANTFCRSCRK